MFFHLATPIPQACTVPEMNRVKQTSLSCNFDKDTCEYKVPVYPHLWERTSYRYGNSNIGEIIGDQSAGMNVLRILAHVYG